ncbi:maestro heat-like repeat-containing protein family member 2B [Mauremys reevesii]|uniref:maestro heat-like repeat-containing protein family member 2B n=1 Tax=Mauremys reevesii TaxID=260615 RepID=UPI00193FCD6D|nr:maestro heat-like repeat-containing protein family member 2B [Mauremys reevesii]
MPLPRISSWSLFQTDQQHTEGNPCRFSVQALESVLSKAGNERLVRVLRTQKTWILLENPQTHHEGVCLLVSGLLRFGLITLEIIQSLLPGSEVIGESMKALAKVLKELKEKDIGSSFKDLTEQIRAYFDDAKENAELLENLYSTTIASFSSSWEGIRAGAANLAGER